MTTILKREGEKRRWLHYFIISDNREVFIEMEPAIMGWNLKQWKTHGAEDWLGYAEASIVAWRLDGGAERVTETEASAVEAMLNEKQKETH